MYGSASGNAYGNGLKLWQRVALSAIQVHRVW